MKIRLFTFIAVLALGLPAAATASDAGVTIRGVTVNGDRSVSISWSFGSPNVSNSSIFVDGVIVRSASDRATWFKTAPLSGGTHTITIEAQEVFETYSAVGSACRVSGGHWVCVETSRASASVSVPLQRSAQSVVPRVVGLLLRVAKARITGAGFSLGAVGRVVSNQPAGTVLAQEPKGSRALSKGAAVRLVVSKGSAPGTDNRRDSQTS
jgi:hypothetical protein